MPAGFEKEINVSQTILKEKYGTSTYVIQRRKREAGKVRKEPTMCDYRQNITCNGGDKAKCARRGWNPEEHRKILEILERSGMDAVRGYISARDMPPDNKSRVKNAIKSGMSISKIKATYGVGSDTIQEIKRKLREKGEIE